MSLERRPLRGLAGRDAEKVVEPELVVGPVGRKEVDRSAGGHRRCQGLRQRSARPDVGHADLLRAFGDRRQIAHPYDVVDGQLVAEDRVAVLVDVDHRRQLGLIEPEVVEKR